MYYCDFIYEFEEIIYKVIQESFPRYWREDSITDSLLKELEKRFYSFELEGGGHILKIEWETYKATGNLETKLGDILVIVRYQDKENSNNLIGVSSLEAKKRYDRVDTFDAIKFEQLKKITDNLPLSKLLLYDYETINNFYIPFGVKTNMVTLPSSICTALKKKNLSLYNFCLPLSLQFATRYFNALDLDFNQNVIDSVYEYINDKNQEGSFQYILTLHISKNGDSFKGDTMSDIFNIPLEKYKKIIDIVK
ncbi:hypothetical protein ACR3AM_003140 [Bacillus thuringiensis]